jgi:hypothetical protein
MSHNPSDPALNSQFRRNWNGSATGIRFLGELGEQDLDRLALLRGETILRRLPARLLAELRAEERRDLARAFGRPWIRRLQERRPPEREPLIPRARPPRC